MKEVSSKNIVSILHPQIKVVWGAMKQMLHMADYLAKNNSVSFYVFEKSSVHVDKDFGFPIISFYSTYPMKFLSFILIAWHIRKSDIIICWNSPMHFVAILSKIIFWSKAKIIWWHHHFPWYFQENTGITTYFKKIIELRCITNIDTIVWNSRFLQTQLQSIYKRKIWCIFPRIEDIYFETSTTIKNKAKKTKRLFAVSRWDSWKWLTDIFNVYESLKNNFDIELYIWWTWKDLDKYKKKHESDPNISFLWYCDSRTVRDNLLETDVFLFLSKIDSFWLVILESLLTWVPVISYDKGEASYIIKNWINWYAQESIEWCISMLDTLLRDRELLAFMKNQSRKSVISNYSKDIFEKQLEHIIFEK